VARNIASFGAIALIVASTAVSAQDKPEASNMRLVGYSDLQARSAYQPLVHQQGHHWIAYIGHHGGIPEVEKPVNSLTSQPEFNGTSLVDVTDPAHPKYLAHIPGEQGNYEVGGAQMVRVCDGKNLAKGGPNAAVRQPGARDLEHIGSGASEARHPHCRGAEGHA
jgi:hypothetical protein